MLHRILCHVLRLLSLERACTLKKLQDQIPTYGSVQSEAAVASSILGPFMSPPSISTQSGNIGFNLLASD